MKELYFNEEGELWSWASYEVDIIPSSKPSYEQLFRMSSQLEKENDKLREHSTCLKKFVRYLKGIIKTFKIEITKILNSKETCEKCISLKKEVID